MSEHQETMTIQQFAMSMSLNLKRWTAGWPALLVPFVVFGSFIAFFSTPVHAVGEMGTNLIVRLYYGDRDRLNELTTRYDVFEFADHAAGYVEARLSPAEYEELVASGFRVEIDPDRTGQANRILAMSAAQPSGIPSFPCYHTVEETYASLAQITNNYPGIASLVNIGSSWDKVIAGGPAGYDLLALVLSNKSRPGPKPRLLIVAEAHARELTTAETATRFAGELAAGYGMDPDITWVLDYFEVHVIPLANPDGRKKAEQGQLWRKNTDSDDGCATTYGVDLNRNFSFKWGLAGSSANPCDDTYHGPASFSEPEEQAVRDYILSLFPDQRGPADTDAAPTNTTGLIITLHSYGPLVLYPWGWTSTAAPNAAALQMLGGRFGYFNRYPVEQTIQLYAVSGELNDWVYGELGVPTYTFEMGTDFFQSCPTFESTVYPSNRLALLYACKACRQPYLSPAGPDVLQAAVVPGSGTSIVVTALAVSGRSFGYTPLPTAPVINAARYSIDDPSWVPGAVTYPMTAADGFFSTSSEAIIATVNTAGWRPGRHTLFIEARTGSGNWGAPTAVFVNVPSPALTATLESGQIVLRWPSVSNASYTLLQSPDLSGPFGVLAGSIAAQPPTNTWSEPLNPAAVRFYRLQIQP